MELVIQPAALIRKNFPTMQAVNTQGAQGGKEPLQEMQRSAGVGETHLFFVSFTQSPSEGIWP